MSPARPFTIWSFCISDVQRDGCPVLLAEREPLVAVQVRPSAAASAPDGAPAAPGPPRRRLALRDRESAALQQIPARQLKVVVQPLLRGRRQSAQQQCHLARGAVFHSAF